MKIEVDETFCTKPLHVVYNTSYIQINNNEITFKVRGFLTSVKHLKKQCSCFF